MLTNKDAILAEIEGTYGTDPTPAAGTNAMLVTALDVRPMEQTLVDRALKRGYLGGSEQLPGTLYATVSFEVELAGSGAAGTAPAFACLLKACGFAETVTADTKVEYSPVSAAFDSVTIYAYKDAVLHKLTGARGNMEISMPNQGIPRFKFTFWGLYTTPSDASLSGAVYTGFVKPVICNRTNTTPFQLHSYSALTSSLDLNLGNRLVFRDLINYTSGTEKVLITDRNATGSIVTEAKTVATKGWYPIIEAATLDTLAVTHGLTAGNIVKIDCPKVQLIQPQYSEQDGITMLSLGLRVTPNAGNDELKLTFQ
jgi:hypothetical protein